MKFTKRECDAGYALLQWMEGLASRPNSLNSHRMPEAAVDRILALQKAEAASRPSATELFGRDDDAQEATTSLRFVIATPPSSKNNRHAGAYIDKDTGKARGYMFRDTTVKDATVAIRQAVALALMRQAPDAFRQGRPLWEVDDVRVEVVHNVHNETCDVTMLGAGKPPKKGTTGRKRDVTNLPELILDAAQRVAYTNDNQVADLRVYRNVATPTTELL